MASSSSTSSPLNRLQFLKEEIENVHSTIELIKKEFSETSEQMTHIIQHLSELETEYHAISESMPKHPGNPLVALLGDVKKTYEEANQKVAQAISDEKSAEVIEAYEFAAQRSHLFLRKIEQLLQQ